MRLTETSDNRLTPPLHGQRDGEAEGMRLRLFYRHREVQGISPRSDAGQCNAAFPDWLPCSQSMQFHAARRSRRGLHSTTVSAVSFVSTRCFLSLCKGYACHTLDLGLPIAALILARGHSCCAESIEGAQRVQEGSTSEPGGRSSEEARDHNKKH